MHPDDKIHPGPDQIAAMLEQERTELSASIDDLRSRLSVDVLMGDALGSALGYAKANVTPYARALDGAVRANPMAAVMAGVGLAWLIFGRRGNAARAGTQGEGTWVEALSRWEDEGGPPSPLPDSDTTWITEADALRDRASRLLAGIDAVGRRNMRPAAALAQDRARVLADLAGATRDVMQQGLESLTAEARGQMLALREETYAARLAAVRQGRKLIEKRPLTASAISLAIGAAVASALPRTSMEDRIFGQERDRLLAHAQDRLRRERARIVDAAPQMTEGVAANGKGSAQDFVSQPA